MELNKGLYLDLVRRAEEIGSENENLEIIERGNAIFFFNCNQYQITLRILI